MSVEHGTDYMLPADSDYIQTTDTISLLRDNMSVQYSKNNIYDRSSIAEMTEYYNKINKYLENAELLIQQNEDVSEYGKDISAESGVGNTFEYEFLQEYENESEIDCLVGETIESRLERLYNK